MSMPERMLTPVDAAMAALAAAVRPEYRTPLLVPPPGNRLFKFGHCDIPGCAQTAWSRRNMCGAHSLRWFHAQQAGAVWEEWVTTASPHTAPRPCLVQGCEYGRSGHGLCARHVKRWRTERPDAQAAEWAAMISPIHVADPPLTCTIPRCEVWRHGNLPFCSSDQKRWDGFRKSRPDATLEDFVGYVERTSIPVLNLSNLPPRLALEVQYVFQSWVDRGTKRTDLYGWNIAMRALREADETSILDVPASEWVSRIGTASGRATGINNYAAMFFRWGWNELDVLLNGMGWDREYPRDEWRLAYIGYPEYPKRTLDFVPIRQPWLRELAKRWLRHRLALGISVTTTGLDMMALQHLSSCLEAGSTPPASAAEFGRGHIEAWMAQAAIRFPVDRTRTAVLYAIRTFLRTIHQFQWAPELPASTMLHGDDVPRDTRHMPGRAISEFVMAQIETPESLATMRDPAYRVILELMIRCGLRAGDAVHLGLECLVQDDEGNPYLHYLNHKMKRDAYAPVDDELAERLRQQRREVEDRYSGGTATKMFPGRTANIDGTRATTAGGFRHAVQEWLGQLALTDEHGQPVRVTPHQFRHTFGTRLINNDVPQHIVQQLMDHSSPEMTSHYARLHDRTVRRAWEKARKINAEGNEVELDGSHPLAAAQWLRTGIARAKQTLPNGYCGMPVQSDCAHANPCLTCPLFITTPEFLPQHETQLRTTLTLIEKSEAAGHARIAEKNRQIAGNLTRIIDACKSCAPAQIVVGGQPTTDEQERPAHAS
ncbi:tyrosine-type recombinase/integrase [Agromyces sp. Soil535]|uniref:tyrosine-type recombinase/integrase n=1 Tax=Agromyces sp. Soil535 TaxID=1736390 RepID=UPI0006F91F50|nr:tyrosine-type recombinase/integrase [Agromyces sp. Soil535]KRE29589.1 hypothetical protein ASG80_19310 [Agromyces sp. Soil535]